VTPVPSPLAIRSGVGGAVGVEFRAYDGRTAVRARVDGATRRGALARRDGDSIAAAARAASQFHVPLVLELTSSGADVTDGIDALHGWGGAAAAVAACSGVVPIVGLVTGPVVSGPALMLGLCDVVAMDSAAVAFVSGPAMVEAFTGVRLQAARLGGVAVHAAASGLCAVESDDLERTVATLLGYLPDHADQLPPTEWSSDPVDRLVPELTALVPDRDNAAYDIRAVGRAVLDDGELTELWARWAPQLVTAFGRIGGQSVGIVANQPGALAGTLDIAASQKGARFVRLCDAFNVPLVTLVDTPGFLPGKDLEWRGMIRHGAELAFSYAEATVPRVCLILRKAFGGAYIVMDSKGIGNDVCLAWPGAEIAVMGAPGAVQILHRRADGAERREREDEYRSGFLTPWPAAERGFVDGVIDPADTRRALAASLAALATKRERLPRRKHSGTPL
jgi:acetyl-CoA carboxylase carboxyltransferase component